MKRPICNVVIFAICGIYWRLGTSYEVCLISFFFLAFLMFRFVKERYYLISLLACIFLLGGYVYADNRIEQKEPLFETGMEICEGVGTVKDVGKTGSGNTKLKLDARINTEGNTQTHAILYVIDSEKGTFSVGEEVKFSGSLEPFSRASIPTTYDEWLYLTTRGYDAKLYPESILKTGEKSDGFLVSLESFKERLQNSIDEVMPEKEAAIVKALLTGEKDDIDQMTEELYQKAGITHILCISGLHISMLLLALERFLNRVLCLSVRKSAPITMAFGLLFLLFTGFSSSAVRAIVMAFVALLGRMTGYRHDVRTNLALSAGILLIIQPLYLWDAGFQLSFLTVLGICVGNEYLEKKDFLPKWFKNTVLITIIATIFTFPLTAYYFHSISPAGFLTNLVVIPLSGLLLGASFLVGVFSLFSAFAAQLFAYVVQGILWIYETVCVLTLQLPYSYLSVGSPTVLEMIFSYVFLLAVFWEWKRARNYCLSVVSSAGVLCVLLLYQPLVAKENYVTFLSVGQGDAAVIVTDDKRAFVIDGGGTYGKDVGENVGVYTLIPYLEYMGITEVEAAFLSHMDSDHATGILELMEYFQVNALYLPQCLQQPSELMDQFQETVEKNSVSLYTVKEGDSAQISENSYITCLYPKEDTVLAAGDDNGASMVLSYHCGDTTILFTGDIGTEDEEKLDEQLLQADILKVAHHGSKYSSSTSFLQKTGAKTAVISRGKDNLYAHPHEETLTRLREEKMEIFDTALDGSVFVTIHTDGYEITTMRDRDMR